VLLESKKLIRSLFFYGSLISLIKMMIYFYKLDAAMNKKPDAIFQHETIFARFKAAESKFLYGQNLNTNQKKTIERLECEGMEEDQVFGLLLGRYLNSQGNIVINPLLEMFLILLVLLLAGLILILLSGLAYDLILHTKGAASMRLLAWIVVALFAVFPTSYFSLLLLRPPATYYSNRSLIAQVNSVHHFIAPRVMKLHK